MHCLALKATIFYRITKFVFNARLRSEHLPAYWAPSWKPPETRWYDIAMTYGWGRGARVGVSWRPWIRPPWCREAAPDCRLHAFQMQRPNNCRRSPRYVQTGNATTTRRTAVREIGVSRHHGAHLRAPLKPLGRPQPPETPQTITALWYLRDAIFSDSGCEFLQSCFFEQFISNKSETRIYWPDYVTFGRADLHTK